MTRDSSASGLARGTRTVRRGGEGAAFGTHAIVTRCPQSNQRRSSRIASSQSQVWIVWPRVRSVTSYIALGCLHDGWQRHEIGVDDEWLLGIIDRVETQPQR